MKRTVVAIAALGLIAGSVVAANPAQAGTLDVQGATLSWDDASFFAPEGCSRFKFNWSNGTSRELLELSYILESRFGDQLGKESKTGIAPGSSGIFDDQICDFALTDGLGPYSLVLRIEDYSSRGGGAWEVSAPLTFLSRTPTPAADPSPAPATPTQAKSVKCISKKTFKKKTFKGKWGKKQKCPKGWIKI